MQNLIQDLRYSIRMLLKNPGFTAVAALVLALGIGANTAVFSIANGLLFKPLPGQGGPEIVGLFSRDRTKPDTYRAFSYPNYVDIREKNQAFSDLMAHNFAMAGVTEGDNTRRAFVDVVSANYFKTLGVSPILGRAFTIEEERPGAGAPVAIVAYDYWKKSGFDPALVGRTIKLNARSFTIVGVAPAGFGGTMAIVSPEFWVPLGVYDVIVNDMFRASGQKAFDHRENHSLVVVGRLKPGLTIAAAEPMLRTLSAQMEQAFPAENKNQTLTVHKLSRLSVSTSPQEDDELTTMMALLLAMSGIVLLIACLNLANMMLARGAARRKELAIRLALGGGRWRIVRQLLTEGLVLSIIGGAAGLVLAFWSTRLLVASLTPVMPLLITFEPSPDVRVLAATMAFCVLSTLFFALGPAWKQSRADVLPELKAQAGEPPVGGLGGKFSARNFLVVGQVALSLTLLTAGGLFIRGAANASEADPGFRLDRGLLVGVDPSLAGYDETRGKAIYRTLAERLRGVPGIESVSFASVVPFGEFTEGRDVQKAGTPLESPDSKDGHVDAIYYIIGTGYFRTLGLPVLRGRDFTADEETSATGPPVVIIDEPLARKLFAGQDPLGQQLQAKPRSPGQPPIRWEIVGVVPGLRHDLFDAGPVPHVYVPFGQEYRASMNFHLRTAAVSAEAQVAMLGTLRREIQAFDSRLPIITLKTLTGHRDGSIGLWMVGTGARMFSVFGGVALFLAVVGVYAVKAYVVSRRTREIGIRMALGASPRDVLGMVLREGLTLTLVGLVLGLGLAALTGRVLSSMLYQVSALDPVIFVAAPVLLAAAALLACYLPARRATKVVPLTALRAE